MNYATRPPEKLSDLIALAIADARRLDRTLYRPFSEVWHESQDSICHICLAGCVIAATLEAPQIEVAIRDLSETDEDRPAQIASEEWRQALEALDHARRGEWTLAITTRGVRLEDDTADGLRRISPPRQRGFDGWEKFDKHLRSLEERVGELRELGV